MGPNIARNAIVNCTELVTYDLIKDALISSTPLTGDYVYLTNSIVLFSGFHDASLVLTHALGFVLL